MWDQVATLVPGGGLAGSVAGLLALHAKIAREDRREYREALAAQRADFDKRADEDREHILEDEAHGRAEIAELRRQLAEAHTLAETLQRRLHAKGEVVS